MVAKKFEVPENWVAPVYEKDEASETFLKDTMAANKLMKCAALAGPEWRC